VSDGQANQPLAMRLDVDADTRVLGFVCGRLWSGPVRPGARRVLSITLPTMSTVCVRRPVMLHLEPGRQSDTFTGASALGPIQYWRISRCDKCLHTSRRRPRCRLVEKHFVILISFSFFLGRAMSPRAALEFADPALMKISCAGRVQVVKLFRHADGATRLPP